MTDLSEDSCQKKTSDYVQQNRAMMTFSDGSSWVILSEIEQSIKQKVEAAGTPLSEWDVNIYRGILTGYNDAYIISTEKRDEILGSCESDEERQRTADIIRPILRGRDIHRYGYNWANLWIINVHNGIKGLLERIHIEDYPAIKRHLDSYWTKIEPRSDQGDTPYNLRNCAYMDDLLKPKIVWGNLNRCASYTYVGADMFINAPCTMIAPANMFLLGVLNSKLADFYIRSMGVVRNGGYFEYKPMYVGALPVPHNVDLNGLELIFKQLIDGGDEKSIDDIVYQLYGLSPDEIDFLNRG